MIAGGKRGEDRKREMEIVRQMTHAGRLYMLRNSTGHFGIVSLKQRISRGLKDRYAIAVLLASRRSMAGETQLIIVG